MAEITPLRPRNPWPRKADAQTAAGPAKTWTNARDYGVPKPRRKARGGGGWGRAARELGPTLWAVPLAVFAILAFAGPPTVASFGLAPSPTARDPEAARFSRCGVFARDNCVIDGDTFRYRGQKIRVADINTPETSSPKCAAEAELGARATARFTELLNAGAFSLQPADRATDRYGRALFTVMRGGESVGAALVREGLAEEWRGYRREWC